MNPNKKNALLENYLATAPIGQIVNVKEEKIEWMKLNFVPYFPKNRKCSILEVGPGQGELLDLLKEMGYKNINSVEISRDVCEHIKKKGFDCELAKDTTKYLSFHKNKYDLIVLNDVLEHIDKEEVVGFVSSMYGSLRKGGLLLVKVPNAQSPHFSLGRYGDLTHVQSFTETSFTQLFNVSGFKNFSFKAEEIPLRKNINGLLSKYLVRPLYFRWIRAIRSASGHSSPEILTQAILAIAIK